MYMKKSLETDNSFIILKKLSLFRVAKIQVYLKQLTISKQI